MNARVKVIGLSTFKNKKDRTSYVVNLELMDERENVVGHEVYKAFTWEKHYNVMLNRFQKAKEPVYVDGYLNFENGFTNFSLPKTEVVD